MVFVDIGGVALKLGGEAGRVFFNTDFMKISFLAPSHGGPLAAICVSFLVGGAAAEPARALDLPEVVVTASRVEQLQSDAAVVVDVITRAQIERSGASNVAEFLDTVEGVNLSRLYGRSGVDSSLDIGYMGESGAYNVLVLIDGQRINPADQSSIRFAQLPMSSVQRIEIRKANGGALYGDRAQGGVVNIITRDDDAKEIGVSTGSFGTTKFDAYLGLKADQARGSIALMSAHVDGYRRQSAAQQNSVQVKMASSGDWGRLGWYARGFEETAQMPSYLSPTQWRTNPRSVGAYPRRSERSGGSVGLRYDRAFSDASAMSVDISNQSSKEASYDTIQNERITIVPEYQFSAGDWLLLVGAEWSKASADTDGGKQVGQRSSSMYVNVASSLTADSTLELSGRTQRVLSEFQANDLAAVTSDDKQKLGLSAALRQQIGATTVLRTGALSGFRFPNADELYLFDATTYAMLTINPQVKPMGTKEYFVQLEHAFATGNVQMHYRDIRATAEIGFAPDCGLVAGSLAACNANLYDTRRQVLSLGSQWRSSASLTLKAGVDLIHAVIDSGANDGMRIPLTPRRVAHFSATQTIAGYALTAIARYRGNMVQASDPSRFYSPIPARTVVDVGLSRSFSKNWTLSAWLRNAFDKNYYDYAMYDGVYPADGRSIVVNVKAAF